MFIGIDVGSKHLAAATSAAPTVPRRVPNTAAGIARLTAALSTLAPEPIALEATGTYPHPLLAALLLAALPVSVANPAQIAAFRTTGLGRHKTDRQDAKLLARFAALHHAALRRATPDEPDLAQLRALLSYRDDLVAQRTAARNRRHAAQWRAASAVVAWLEADLAAIDARLRAVKAAIAVRLATRPETAVLIARAGVGPLVAAAGRASRPAGVLGNPKAAAASAGRHPRHEQSGQRDRGRWSNQGSPARRRYRYLAALGAIRWDPEIAAWHQRLRERGKAAKSAIGAVAHQLLRRMMGRIRALREEHPALLPLAA